MLIASPESPPDHSWIVSAPMLEPGPEGSFDEIAVKDPSLVFFEGRWHVFYTARSETEYTTGYVSAPKLTQLQAAPRHSLEMIRGKTRYGCAPQVLYFEPRREWFLLFQSRDANYQPAFSTTRTIAKPESWSAPTRLLRKDDREKWIDFWVICDETRAYLFYTRGHREVRVRSTTLGAFPRGWSEARKVFEGVHEAVHVYRVRGQDEFHMIYELNRSGLRSFGLARSERLAGPWLKVTDAYASAGQLEFAESVPPWTDRVSHGEVLRSGYDQNLEYDPENCRWLIQGLLKEDADLPYPSLPWKLGLLKRRG